MCPKAETLKKRSKGRGSLYFSHSCRSLSEGVGFLRKLTKTYQNTRFFRTTPVWAEINLRQHGKIRIKLIEVPTYSILHSENFFFSIF